MGRKKTEPKRSVWSTVLSGLLVSCCFIYAFLLLLRGSWESETEVQDNDNNSEGCCRGVQNLELWGDVVKWGSEFKVNTSEQCCSACKSTCAASHDGNCLCDTWVFCGNPVNCGSKFGECWLKKQKDSLTPEKIDTEGEPVRWTSGLILGKENGIIGLETEFGTLRVKLFPDCAPHSVAYILELLQLHLCVGCQFFRAESRGQSWNSKGNHLKNAAFGPPYALIQGTLEDEGSEGTTFKKIPIEDCPSIKRGSVAWVDSGPEFFISLSNHWEWKNKFTVFGSVLPQDMHIAERISILPTKSDVWNNVNLTILEKPVPFMLRRIEKDHENFNTKANSA